MHLLFEYYRHLPQRIDENWIKIHIIPHINMHTRIQVQPQWLSNFGWITF